MIKKEYRIGTMLEAQRFRIVETPPDKMLKTKFKLFTVWMTSKSKQFVWELVTATDTEAEAREAILTTLTGHEYIEESEAKE